MTSFKANISGVDIEIVTSSDGDIGLIIDNREPEFMSPADASILGAALMAVAKGETHD